MASIPRLTVGSSAEQVECRDELITDILSKLKIASIPRLTVGSSAEQVECRDELITDLLSRVSTADVLKMSTVSKRWRTLICDPDFAYTHYKNCDQASIFSVDSKWISFRGSRMVREFYQFRSYNFQTVKLSTLSWEGLDSEYDNENFELFATSNGLMCFHTRYLPEFSDPMVWLYNPARKISKELSMPFTLDINRLYLAQICYTQDILKFVMAGFSRFQKRQYTLVFDFHSNSWYEGSPPLIDLSDYSFLREQLFLNGVIYFVTGIAAKESTEIRDVEALFIDDDDDLYMIMGYDVNRDQWGFSIYVPASVGFIYCLTEWEGNLLVCASNSKSNHSPRGKPGEWDCDGQFVFWILDTKHKQWIRERELDLSQQSYYYWRVSASGGVVCFTCGYNYVIVYHMKTRHCSTHRLDDAFDLGHDKFISFVTFEPTILPF